MRRGGGGGKGREIDEVSGSTGAVMSGVPQFWIVDPNRPSVQHHGATVGAERLCSVYWIFGVNEVLIMLLVN